MRPFALATALALATACTGGTTDDPNDYRAVLPDDRVLVNLPVTGGARDGAYAEAYAFTAEVTSGVNGMIAGVLGAIDTATGYPPTWSSEEESTAVWGPWPTETGSSELALWVHHDVATDTYTWAVGGRPMGETSWDAFEGIVVGQVNPGATEEVSDGWFYFDFDIAASYDETTTASGRFLNEYHLTEDGAWANAAFEQFSGDGEPAVDAFYHYEQDLVGDGLMDLAWLGDVNPESGTGKVEGHVMRSRWLATGEGRADAAVGGGDLEDWGVIGAASECWGADFTRTFYWNNWDPSATEGEAASCVFADAELPPEE